MTRARDIANLVDANGDVVAGALDNVPASNDASALTTGTLAAARLPSSGVDASSLSTGTLNAARIANASLPSAKLSTSPINFVRESVTLLTGFNTHQSSARIIHHNMASTLNSNTIGLILGFRFMYNATSNTHGYVTGYYEQENKSSAFRWNVSHQHFDWYFNIYEVEGILPWDGSASNQYLDFRTTSTHFTHSGNQYSFYYRGRIDRG